MRTLTRLGGLSFLVLVLLFTPVVASALTACNLSGTYVVSTAIDTPWLTDQMIGRFTFTPPSPCAAGAPGTVTLTGTMLQRGNPTSSPITATVPYLVNDTGALTIHLLPDVEWELFISGMIYDGAWNNAVTYKETR